MVEEARAFGGAERAIGHVREERLVVQVNPERQLEGDALEDRDPAGALIRTDEVAPAQAGDRAEADGRDHRNRGDRPEHDPQPVSAAARPAAAVPAIARSIDVRVGVGPQLRRQHGDRPRRRGVLVVFGRDEIVDPEDDHGDVVLPARGQGGPDELGRRRRGVAVVEQQPPDRVLINHRGQAVAAQQHHVAGLGIDREGVHAHVRLGPQRARDHAALRVVFGRRPRSARPGAPARRPASGRRSGAATRHRGAGRRGCRRRARRRWCRRRPRARRSTVVPIPATERSLRARS